MKFCELCKRDVEILTKHHLVPKQRGGKKGDMANVCLSCAGTVHKLFTNKELEKKYNTIESLLKTLKVQNYVRWIKKQKKEQISIAAKKKKR